MKPGEEEVGQEVCQTIQYSHNPYSNNEIVGIQEVTASMNRLFDSQCVRGCVPQLVWEDSDLLHHLHFLFLGLLDPLIVHHSQSFI